MNEAKMESAIPEIGDVNSNGDIFYEMRDGQMYFLRSGIIQLPEAKAATATLYGWEPVKQVARGIIELKRV